MPKLLSKVRRDYEKIASSFSDTRRGTWEEIAYICNLVPEGSSVLDLGCGNGRLVKELSRKKVKYLGLDSSSSLLDLAKKQHPGAAFLEMDFTRDLSDLKQQFDFVISIAALHHLPGKALRLKVFKEIRKLLKPSGQFYLTVWNLQRPPYRKYLYLSRFLNFGRYGWNDTFIPWKASKQTVWRYYHAFSTEELDQLLQESGFQKKDVSLSERNNLIRLATI